MSKVLVNFDHVNVVLSTMNSKVKDRNRAQPISVFYDLRN